MVSPSVPRCRAVLTFAFPGGTCSCSTVRPDCQHYHSCTSGPLSKIGATWAQTLGCHDSSVVTKVNTEWLAGRECLQQGDAGQRGDCCGRRRDSTQQVTAPVPSLNWLGREASRNCREPTSLPSKLPKKRKHMPRRAFIWGIFCSEKVLGKWS